MKFLRFTEFGQNPWQWFVIALTQKYASFDGRATRAEYWSYFFIQFAVSFAVLMLALIVSGSDLLFTIAISVFGLMTLTFIIPSFAVAWRRLHDIGKSGVWYLVTFVPFIGPLFFLILTLEDSQKFDNEYGPQTKL